MSSYEEFIKGKSEFAGMKGLTYQCVRCKKLISGEELQTRERITCPSCGYRVLQKIRNPIVRRVRAT